MQVHNPRESESQSRPLRAVVEITVDGEVMVLPVADSDQEAAEIVATIVEWGRRQ